MDLITTSMEKRQVSRRAGLQGADMDRGELKQLIANSDLVQDLPSDPQTLGHMEEILGQLQRFDSEFVLELLCSLDGSTKERVGAINKLSIKWGYDPDDVLEALVPASWKAA